MLITARYTEALSWAAELHLDQRRKGKAVPYISHLIAVSGMVWEDGGDEDQAIAGLLHDAIEDAGQSRSSIADRFGDRVARIVADCTDTSGAAADAKEPWLARKTRYVAHLAEAQADSLLVAAADKAHNARDQVLDARRDPRSWSRFNAGLAGTAWYMSTMHATFAQRLPTSRSVGFLGESVAEILGSAALVALAGDQDLGAWVAAYPERG